MEQSQKVLPLLFTDSQGMVIFADSHLLRLFNYGEAGMVVGEPLHTVLQLTAQTTSQLMRTIAQTGHVYDLPLDIQARNGDIMHVLCTGVATYDDRNNFIGADITLNHPSNTDYPMTHEDSLSRHIQQVQAEAEFLENENPLQVYMAAQLGALDILLARIGGPRVRKTFTGIALKKAEKLRLPLRMADGDIQLNCQASDPDSPSCLDLLQEVVDYASSILGRRIILAEMRAVDERVNAHIQDIADHAGLRKILNSR